MITKQFINQSYLKKVKKLIVVARKDLYLPKDLIILKYSVPYCIERNQELMKKIWNWKMLILNIVVVALFIYI